LFPSRDECAFDGQEEKREDKIAKTGNLFQFTFFVSKE